MSTHPMQQGADPGATQPMTATGMPPLKPVPKKRLPDGIAANVKQHVILACDCSTSMGGQKIGELNIAREALVVELADPENRDGFLVTVIEFDSDAMRVCLAESASALALSTAHARGGTNFEAALRECLDAIDAVEALPNDAGWHYLRPNVLFLSDGQSNADPALIDAVKEKATVISIAYGSDADQAMLSRIASDGQVHVVGTQGDALRQFLASVGKTMSDALQQAN